MPNVYAPSGFLSGRPYEGRQPNFAMRPNVILYNYATKIAQNDPVFLATDGTIRLYAAAGTTFHGIFRGCRYFDPPQGKTMFYNQWTAPTYLASTTYVEALVDIDPWSTLICQAQGGPLGQANIGQNVDIVGGTSGQPTGAGISTCALNAAAPANTATLPFRIVGIVGWPNVFTGMPAMNPAYDPTQSNQFLEVLPNTSDITTRTGQA